MKKILFNDKYGLTAAVLEGRKTMTRRIITDKEEIDAMAYAGGSVEKKIDYLLSRSMYKIGEVVAVAQRGIDIYHALQMRYGQTSDAALGFKEMYKGMPMWNNKMFVPADLCPSLICITDINVERLQYISDEDCMREGVLHSDKYAMPYGLTEVTAPNGVYFYYSSPREAFADLIDKVSGIGTWEHNPLVSAYSFEHIK